MNQENKIRVGIIGLGKIAQTKYIPILHQLEDAEIVSLCDQSASLAKKVTQYYGYPHSCADYTIEQVIDKKPDIVFLLTHDHYAIATSLVCASISICVEKPFCWSSLQATTLKQVAEQHHASVFACYMKQFEPGFLNFRSMLQEWGAPMAMQVTCYAGNNKKWCDPLFQIMKESNSEKEHTKHMLKDAWNQFYSERQETDRTSSQLLLQLGIHQINLLRTLFESPLEIESCIATDEAGTRKISAVFSSQGHIINYTLIPLFQAPWVWRESFEALYTDKVITYEPGCPFLPTSQAALHISTGDSETRRTETRLFSFADPFRNMIDSILSAYLQNHAVPDALSADFAASDIRFIESMLQKQRSIT